MTRSDPQERPRFAALRVAARRVRILSRLGLPLSVSLAIHAGIGLLLILGAWNFREGLAGGRARTELVISLPPAAPAAAPRAGEVAGEGARPAPIDAPPPMLQGLTSRAEVAPPPALRSAVVEGGSPGELLRRQDESAIGATFAGLGARQAVRIVYVVDASGAMVSSLKFVFAELERSVRSLSSGQKFQVVLFRERDGGEPVEILSTPGSAGGLVPATAVNKSALASWLAGITPTGRSNPSQGLRRAIEMDPDAIFLLSRSIRRSSGNDDMGVWGQGPQQTLADLDRLNPRDGRGRRRIVIKAIQFLEPDPTGTMQLIGEQHGDGPGSYSVLTLQDLAGGGR